jgi:hypothetical protein
MKNLREPADPVLSPAEMAGDGNVSLATWYRQYRHDPDLEIIQVSPRRIGARQSNWQKVLQRRAEGRSK